MWPIHHGNICMMCYVGKLLAANSACCQLGLMNVLPSLELGSDHAGRLNRSGVLYSLV